MLVSACDSHNLHTQAQTQTLIVGSLIPCRVQVCVCSFESMLYAKLSSALNIFATNNHKTKTYGNFHKTEDNRKPNN